MPVPSFEIVGLLILVFELALSVSRRSDHARDADHDRRSVRWLWIWILIGVGGAHAVTWSGVGPQYRIGTASSLAALSILACGFALRAWAIRALGKWFTVDVVIRPGHQLVTHGPFRLIRHPSYAGLALMFLGWGLLFGNWLALPSLLVPFVLAFLYRVRLEEQTLEAAFPSAYPAYRSRTKRLVPFVY